MPDAQRLVDGVPVLPGYIQGSGSKFRDLRVWCRWCCHWHTHGPEPVGSTTHRIAHCFATDSPYRETGYWIEVSATDYDDVARKVKSASAAQQRAMSTGRVSDAVKRLRDQPSPGAAV
ncbi:hypothetical protein [Streptomyces sp. NPDC058045]|uniref:hypothetical protein n=1 Tax=Streptomyces sp. NPDC058045 TaxID=3346311 RepID=UPI0036E05A1B